MPQYKSQTVSPPVSPAYFIQHLCLHGVHLIERKRRNLKFDAVKRIGNRILPPKGDDFSAEDDVCFLPIYVQHNGDHALYPLQAFHQYLAVRQSFPVEYDADHHLAAASTDACQNMADKPCVCFLIVQGNLKFIQKIAHKGNDSIVPFILQEALLGIHNAVAAFGVKADSTAFLALPHGELAKKYDLIDCRWQVLRSHP